ncbi:MAG: PTS galactosamine transporter subunit IIB [Lactococcus sp.]
MGEPNIVLARVDNRLVHGQVGVVWTKQCGTNLLLVANDGAAVNEIQQSLMAATAESSGVSIRFWTLDKTINNIHKASPRQKIFIVVQTPEDALILAKGGIQLSSLNIGNMHYSEGKKGISNKVFVDELDIQTFRDLISMGIEVYLQELPNDKKVSVKELI